MYSCNENYFEKIDTPNKAYFLGLLYADGCIDIRSKNSSSLNLLLQKEDKHILRSFKKELNFNGKIYFRKKKEKHHQDCYYIIVTFNKLVLDLIKNGCIPRKSLILEWPTENQVPENLISHFVRGFFDGDGSISYQITGRHKNPQFVVLFCGTKHFCDNLNQLLQKKLNFLNRKLYKHKKMFQLSFNGNEQIKNFYNYLYKDAELFLKRKKEKMAQVFKIIPYKSRFI